MPRGNMGPKEKPKDFKSAIKKLIKHLDSFKILVLVSIVLATFGAILTIIGPNKLSDLTDEISKGLVIDEKNLKAISTKIMDSFSEESIKTIMTKEDISLEDKQKFLGFQTKSDNDIDNIPSSIKKELFKDFTYKNVLISYEDQISFIKLMSNLENKKDIKIYKKLDKLPSSIKELIKPKMNMDNIKSIGLFILILYLFSALFNLIQGVIMSTISNRFAQQLRHKLSIKINKLPLKYFDTKQIGDTLSRITNDVDTISMSMNQSMSSLVGAIILFIGSLIMMFVTNSIMALAALISSFIGFVLMSMVLKRSQKYFSLRQKELGKLNSHIEEIYSNHNIVKVYNGIDDAKEKFDKLNQSVYDCNLKSQFLSGLMPPIMIFIGSFSYVAVCVVGASLVIKGSITFGTIVAFIVYVRLFTSPLSQIAQGMTSLQSTAAASERVFEFLEEKEMEDESNIKDKIEVDKVKGKVEFKHVKFGYNKDKIIIKDFNQVIKPGSNVAIVGPTGAGKTTLVNLLMKFYKIDSGDILIDDISINSLTRSNIHDLFIMVLQDTWIYNGTIRDNVKYNKENVTDEEIWESLKMVGIEHFVKSLPGTLDYVVTDNDSVSAGQKQLLTIARGMIKNSPLLILDEATSNVDTRTEKLVSSAMNKLMHGRTSFIIAHRLSTIRNADLILVMKEGNIVETGNHDELIKKNGFYAELYNSQFEEE